MKNRKATDYTDSLSWKVWDLVWSELWNISRDVFPDDATFEKIETLEQMDHTHIEAMVISEMHAEADVQ